MFLNIILFLVLFYFKAHGHILLAHLARESRQLGEAQAHVEEALRVHPNAEMTEARMYLAELRCRNGKHEDALECYDTV